MKPIVLRVEDVQKILNTRKSQSYYIIKYIRENYPNSAKLSGRKIRTDDLAEEYDISLEAIERCLYE